MGGGFVGRFCLLGEGFCLFVWVEVLLGGFVCFVCLFVMCVGWRFCWEALFVCFVCLFVLFVWMEVLLVGWKFCLFVWVDVCLEGFVCLGGVCLFVWLF